VLGDSVGSIVGDCCGDTIIFCPHACRASIRSIRITNTLIYFYDMNDYQSSSAARAD
jgi:hypothetical protein